MKHTLSLAVAATALGMALPLHAQEEMSTQEVITQIQAAVQNFVQPCVARCLEGRLPGRGGSCIPETMMVFNQEKSRMETVQCGPTAFRGNYKDVTLEHGSFVVTSCREAAQNGASGAGRNAGWTSGTLMQCQNGKWFDVPEKDTDTNTVYSPIT